MAPSSSTSASLLIHVPHVSGADPNRAGIASERDVVGEPPADRGIVHSEGSPVSVFVLIKAPSASMARLRTTNMPSVPPPPTLSSRLNVSSKKVYAPNPPISKVPGVCARLGTAVTSRDPKRTKRARAHDCSKVGKRRHATGQRHRSILNLRLGGAAGARERCSRNWVSLGTVIPRCKLRLGQADALLEHRSVHTQIPAPRSCLQSATVRGAGWVDLGEG